MFDRRYKIFNTNAYRVKLKKSQDRILELRSYKRIFKKICL